jgi:hypothetical protein
MSEIEVNFRFLNKVGLHVEDSGGSGRPVVLIHGCGSSVPFANRRQSNTKE